MAVHRDGDPAPDGDRGPEEGLGLPELPAGVVIPDDASALADEAARVRAELRAHRRRRAWTRRHSGPGHGVPLLVMCLAVLVTLASLFALAWAGSTNLRRHPPATPPPMPAIMLTDEHGATTDLSTLGPMVIMLVERCRCTDLIAETVAAAPPGVTVVVVEGAGTGGSGADEPEEPPAPAPTRLVDAEGMVRTRLELGAPPADAATVVLVDKENRIVHAHPAAESVEPYRDLLAGLTR